MWKRSNDTYRNDSLEDLNDIYREQAEVAIRTNQSLKNELLKIQKELMKITHEREMERCVIRQNDEVRNYPTKYSAKIFFQI